MKKRVSFQLSGYQGVGVGNLHSYQVSKAKNNKKEAEKLSEI